MDGFGDRPAVGELALNRASLLRALTLSVILAGSLSLAGCLSEEGGYELPTKAMKALSPQMLALLDQKRMPKESPILIRIFKEESELEVWKQDTTGRFELLKVYPICRWSGDLGPKVNEGDRQAPEGFYTITPNLMNPRSNYHLAINTGFPNAHDRANGRSGSALMIHGDCASVDCYAMTDEQISEIYSLAREAFFGGQRAFPRHGQLRPRTIDDMPRPGRLSRSKLRERHRGTRGCCRRGGDDGACKYTGQHNKRDPAEDATLAHGNSDFPVLYVRSIRIFP